MRGICQYNMAFEGSPRSKLTVSSLCRKTMISLTSQAFGKHTEETLQDYHGWLGMVTMSLFSENLGK